VEKNIVVSDRPPMTIWRKRIACWIPKAINTHSEYVIFIAFPLQQWLNERASLLLYTYIACLVTLCCIGILLFHELCEAAKVRPVTGKPAVLQMLVFEHRVRGIKKGSPPSPPNLQWLIRHKSHNE